MAIARRLLFTILFFTIIICSHAQIRDRINDIRSADPLTISGRVGTSVGLSYNSLSPAATPFSSTIFANLNISIYSFSLPISFYFVNNTTSFSYPQMPTFKLGMMPTWKNWKFHIGYSSMHFSNYSYSGLSFLGAGVEYQGKKLFRFAVFAGSLNRPTKIRGYDNRTAFQQLADSLLGLNVTEGNMPQYRRDAIGVKVGVGNAKNFIDISVLKAKDKEKTLPSPFRDSIAPQENLVIGMSGRFAIKNWFCFAANAGASFYTKDLRDSMMFLGNEVQNILNKTRWLLDIRNNSTIRFAGDAAMNFHARFFNGSLTYRFIMPDYVSLGTSTFSQNTHSIGINTSFSVFKGRSNLMLVGYLQRDNLNRKQMYTNQVATYTLNWNNNITDNFDLSLSYNGIKQDQYDGTMLVADSLRINQITHTATLSPSYTFTKTNTHTFSLNFNFIQNSNLNKKSINDINVMTLTGGIGYAITIEAIHLGVSANYDYSVSKSSYSNYNTHALGLGLSYVIMSKDKLNWNANFNGSFGYNITKDENSSNSFSVSNSIGTSFNYNKAHSASMYLSLSNFSDNIIIGQKVATDLDCRFTLSYTYSFGAKIIKKKSKEQSEEDRLNRKAGKVAKKSRKS